MNIANLLVSIQQMKENMQEWHALKQIVVDSTYIFALFVALVHYASANYLKIFILVD